MSKNLVDTREELYDIGIIFKIFGNKIEIEVLKGLLLSFLLTVDYFNMIQYLSLGVGHQLLSQYSNMEKLLYSD